jgi:Flp pilus assembly protein CpaB
MQDGRTLAGLVRVGLRGYSLSERDASFDGLLRPGDRVDVIFTPVDEASETSMLLHNVLVLTVGGDLGQDQATASVERGGRVTLSVTPEQATVLARREGTGRLRLVLRNPQDAVVPKGEGEAQRSVREHAAAAPLVSDKAKGVSRHGP